MSRTVIRRWQIVFLMVVGSAEVFFFLRARDVLPANRPR